jgi:lysozyme family protein
MADRFDACLAFTLREEGGYVDDRQAAYFAIFGTGWLDRTEARRNAALAMIAGAE